jgi:DNA-binding Lrp family transcriptional regulator|tara:strand:- start:1627 stop:2670 length:1044 start_codon:yes stop_codon:yes gene_type:complete
MKKNIFYLNETDKEKQLNPNNLERFDSKEIGLVLSSNPYLLMKHWISFQQEWVNNIYKEFKDYDKYIILMHLMSKSWQDSSSLFKYYSLDGYYSQNEIILPDLSLSDISRDLKIPKETIRRKLNELEKQNIIERKGQKIILSQLALSLQKPKNSIKKLSIFFEKLSILLSVQDWFGASVSREEIEIYFNKYYSVFWNRYYKMQIPFLIRWKIVFGDLESWVIWANLGINQSLNLEKISKESNEMLNIFSDKGESLYLNNVQRNEPKQGVNSTSIAEISGIPRATVLRKLKKLLREKVIKKNKNLEYVLTDRGKLNDKIQANFIINQRQIALFVTDIFNLIKKTPLKI